MGGVVFAKGGGVTLTKYGQPVSLAAGAVIPAGWWVTGGSYTVTQSLPVGSTATATVLTCSAGLCNSDGVNVKLVAAGNVFPLGA
jgi:hypothetical protein